MFKSPVQLWIQHGISTQCLLLAQRSPLLTRPQTQVPFYLFLPSGPISLECFLHKSFQKDYKGASPGICPSLAGSVICGVVWQLTLDAVWIHCEYLYLVSLISTGLIRISGTKESTILGLHASLPKCITFLSLAPITRFRVLIIICIWPPKFTTHSSPADLSQLLFSYLQRLILNFHWYYASPPCIPLLFLWLTGQNWLLASWFWLYYHMSS